MNDLILDCKLKNIDEWKAILEATSSIIESAMLICNSDGMSIRGTDDTHAALLDITIPDSAFENYVAKTSYFGIQVGELKDVINTAYSTDAIRLSASAHHTLKVEINGELKMEYNLRLLDRTSINIPIPKIEYTSKISMNSHTLTRILSNIHTMSEIVSINCKSKSMEFTGNSDYGDAKISLDKNSSIITVEKFTKDTSANYSLDFLMKIIKSLGKASNVMNFEFANKNPIHVKFKMPSNSVVEYYLAPRLE